MKLHWKILIGLVLGIIVAFISSTLGLSKYVIQWIDPFGQIFIKLLKLLAVPLVLFSIIKGVAGLSDITKLGRIGLKTLGFYVCTTLIAVSTGLFLVNTIQPGTKFSAEEKIALEENIKVFQGESGDTKVAGKKTDAAKMKDGGIMRFFVDMVPDNLFSALSNNRLMLQIIFFAIFFGISLALIDKQKAKPVMAVVDGINEVILRMIELVMRAAPFFVFCLMAGILAKMAQDKPELMWSILRGLSWFAATSLIGLFFFILVVYPLVQKLFVRQFGYMEFFRKISPAQLFAFSTSSSAATLPVTMEVVRDNLKVSEDTTSFVLPIGATVNMDGTSLYQAVCAVFLAQFFGYDLSFSDQITIVGTATLASIGAPAVPSAGLVMLILVLESVGMNPAWIALIFPIDRPIDMVRTMVNVTGDATAATVIAKSEGETFEKPVINSYEN